MLELVVVSGKGGTGKTTITAALCELSQTTTKVDCDVDASNLYLYYNGKDIKKEDFYGGKKAVIDEDKCNNCGKCEAICKFDAIIDCKIDEFFCEGCGACALICPMDAIKLVDEKAAKAFITKLDKGIISRAKMEIGGDGSGKLVTLLRENGKEFSKGEKLTIIDSSPGIGCPVIASITGSDIALVVTEPTKSGLEDLKRVLSLCQHFDIPTMVCINKYDINETMSYKIQDFVEKEQIDLVGKIPYDDTVMKSVNELKPIIYYKESKAARSILNMWENIYKILGGLKNENSNCK